MVWIGLHGIMFLFLFSDFYKAKYLNATRRRRQAVKANGHANGVQSNGHSKHLGEGDASVPNGSNKGACMVSFFLPPWGQLVLRRSAGAFSRAGQTHWLTMAIPCGLDADRMGRDVGKVRESLFGVGSCCVIVLLINLKILTS